MATSLMMPDTGKLTYCHFFPLLHCACISEGLLMCAVQSVLNEPRFKFETEAAKTAYRLASVLDVHKGRIIQFANM